MGREKNTAFYVNSRRADALGCAARAEAFFRRAGYTVLYPQSGEGAKDYEFILSFGGDGTLLEGAREAIAVDCTSSNGPFHADRDLRLDKGGHIVQDGVKTDTLWDGTLALPTKPMRIRFRNICGDESIIPVD